MNKTQVNRFNSQVRKLCRLIVIQRKAKTAGSQYWNRAYKIADLMDSMVEEYEHVQGLRSNLKSLSFEVEKTIDYNPQIW